MDAGVLALLAVWIDSSCPQARIQQPVYGPETPVFSLWQAIAGEEKKVEKISTGNAWAQKSGRKARSKGLGSRQNW